MNTSGVENIGLESDVLESDVDSLDHLEGNHTVDEHVEFESDATPSDNQKVDDESADGWNIITLLDKWWRLGQCAMLTLMIIVIVGFIAAVTVPAVLYNGTRTD